jgi:hypothetical protein
MLEGEITLLSVKPAVGFTHPWAGVTPAPNVEKKMPRRFIASRHTDCYSRFPLCSKPRVMNANHAAALVLLVLTVWIAGCGGSNHSSACATTSGDKVGCNSAAAIGRSPLPDSPFAPRN